MFPRLMAMSMTDKCSCDDEGSLSMLETVFMCQRTSDFLIAIAYFSIPIELLWFVSCSNVPFKWVLFQFIAFIVLCGMTHLLHGLAYGSPHPFELMVALTVSKILTAVVSCMTAITLMTLIPLLLKVKVRELMLRKKARDLGREVGIIMRQREAGLHVRMLTREIRRSLDRHTILYTTLIELSRTLALRNCAVWMPDLEKNNIMNLTHELRNRNDRAEKSSRASISMDDPDLAETIRGSEGVKILGPYRALAVLSSGGSSREEEGLGLGEAVAIRMPMLRWSNFKIGSPDLVAASYAVLVLVLPGERPPRKPRTWTAPEIEMVKVVADQVAVALSHASLLEESQLMREKLEEQNLALQRARRSAVMASRARSSFQKLMNEAMRRPMHTVVGVVSILLEEQHLTENQKLIVNSMARTGNNLAILMDDATEISLKQNSGRLLPLEVKPFHLHAVIREVACLVKCLCNSRGFVFSIEVERSLLDCVTGDERRAFQVILYTVTNLLDMSNPGGLVKLRVFSANRTWERSDPRLPHTNNWRHGLTNANMYIKFEFEMKNDLETGTPSSGNGVGVGQRFSICQRIVQMMQGDVWIVPNSSAGLVLRFQLRPSSIPLDDSILHEKLDPIFRGTTVLLADSNDPNRAVTQKLLEKLGCVVSTVGSGLECLTTISSIGPASFPVVLLELQLPGLDGIEVASRIRKLCGRNWPLILALTASGDEDLRERCVEIGMNGLITKPATLQGIAKELKRVMSQANLVGNFRNLRDKREIILTCKGNN